MHVLTVFVGVTILPQRVLLLWVVTPLQRVVVLAVTCGESTTSMGSDSTSVGDIKSLVDITVHRPQHAPTSKDVAPSSSKSKFTATSTPLPKKLSIKELGTDDSSSSSVNPCEDISGVSSIRSSPEWLSE